MELLLAELNSSVNHPLRSAFLSATTSCSTVVGGGEGCQLVGTLIKPLGLDSKTLFIFCLWNHRMLEQEEASESSGPTSLFIVKKISPEFGAN